MTELPATVTPEPVNLQAQIIILDKVYYRQPGKEPITYSRDYGILVTSDDQPYSRDMKCDETWKLVDFMWIKEPGLILVSNLETPYKEKAPTEQELEDIARKILYLSFIKKPVTEPLRRTMHSPPREVIDPTPDLEVHPRQSIRIRVHPSKDLYIRSASGMTQYNLTVFPGS